MELFKRANAETPTWWKKVRNTAAVIAAISGCLVVAPVGISAAAVGVITHIGIIAASIAGTAQLTTKGE